MTLVFLGVLLLALSWIRALPVFTELPGAWRWFIAGAALVVVGLRNFPLWDGPVKRPMSAAVLASSLVGVLWLAGPFRAGFLLLAIASALSLTPLPPVVSRWCLPGLWVSGLVAVGQAAVVPFLYVFSARYHATAELPFFHDLLPGFPAFPWLAYLLYVPLALVNPGVALNGSTLYLRTPLDTQPFTPTWEKLGLFPLGLFFVGCALVLLLRPEWRRRLIGLSLWISAYAYVRLLVLFLVVGHFRNDRVFWQFEHVLYSLVLLPVLLGAWWRLGTKREERPVDSGGAEGTRIVRRAVSWLRANDRSLTSFPRENRGLGVVIAGVLVAGGLTGYWGFHDPGTPKQGRILIDEGHSDWEWTTQPFDTTWYGGRSGYNYYCLADYWNHFYHVETRRDSLTANLLEQWDVLVIKTPTSPFSADEVDAMVQWVKEGGGLFLIGDHTNVFGTSTYLNPLAERFGMYFRYDATYNLATFGLSVFERPERFAHPVVRSMPDYMFATSCTLYSPLMSENVILGYGLRAMYLDYSEPSYFPTKKEKLNYDFGLFVQAGGVKYGRGRVLGFTDSTCFSNFFMFIPGKPELALASVEWLNRINRWAWVNRVFIIAFVLGLLVLLLEARRNSGLQFWGLVVASVTLTVVVLGLWLDFYAGKDYAAPMPRRQVTHVTFDQAHGSYLLPVETLPVNNWQNFQTFYVWTQRVGIVPRNETSLEKALRDTRALVEIHPVRRFSIEEIDLIVDFVRRGGTLIVMDSPDNPEHVAKTLLGPFGISLQDDVPDSTAVVNAAGDTLGVPRKCYAVKDVVPIWTLGDGRTAMGYRPFEKGKVVACGAAHLFSSEVMGNTAVVPDERQKRLFREEYDLFEQIVGIAVRGRYQMDDPAPDPQTSPGR